MPIATGSRSRMEEEEAWQGNASRRSQPVIGTAVPGAPWSSRTINRFGGPSNSPLVVHEHWDPVCQEDYRPEGALGR